LYGVDLFNHGYYWEAHESWEGLWLACGRSGRTAWFLKGLIKLAAAGVKAREQNPRGLQRHARRAAELFRQTAHELGAQDIRFMGLSLTELIGFAGEIATRTLTVDTSNQRSVEVVFNFILRLG
jgi:predicted metal-dependent hydrolase